jgi:hypothetical protein
MENDSIQPGKLTFIPSYRNKQLGSQRPFSAPLSAPLRPEHPIQPTFPHPFTQRSAHSARYSASLPSDSSWSVRHDTPQLDDESPA